MEQVVIIPSLDPTNRLLHVVGDLQRVGFSRIIVVNDGSDAGHEHVFDVLAQRGIAVASHPVNLGKGSAIKTGILQARVLYPDAPSVVTCDGDGQHTAYDVRNVCLASRKNAGSLVLGIRDFSSAGVPKRSLIGNSICARLFAWETGIDCPDTQTGLRCIPAEMLPLALSVKGARFDYEMNFLLQAASRGVGIRQVPISTIYENNNASTHFRTVADSLLVAQGVARTLRDSRRMKRGFGRVKRGDLHARKSIA